MLVRLVEFSSCWFLCFKREENVRFKIFAILLCLIAVKINEQL